MNEPVQRGGRKMIARTIAPLVQLGDIFVLFLPAENEVSSLRQHQLRLQAIFGGHFEAPHLTCQRFGVADEALVPRLTTQLRGQLASMQPFPLTAAGVQVLSRGGRSVVKWQVPMTRAMQRIEETVDREATLHFGASLRLLRAALSLAVLLVVLSACGGSEGQASTTVAPAAAKVERQTPAIPTIMPTAATPTATPGAPSTEPARPTTVSVAPSTEPEAVQAVRRELAGRLSVAVSHLKAVSVESVTWPDASLGCPQEGYAYAQVVTPGYRVVMEHNGQRYTYHTNATASYVVTC